jgi:hypothetical protein
MKTPQSNFDWHAALHKRKIVTSGKSESGHGIEFDAFALNHYPQRFGESARHNLIGNANQGITRTAAS